MVVGCGRKCSRIGAHYVRRWTGPHVGTEHLQKSLSLETFTDVYKEADGERVREREKTNDVFEKVFHSSKVNGQGDVVGAPKSRTLYTRTIRLEQNVYI